MRASDVPERLANLELAAFVRCPWVEGPDVHERRVAIISTAGLMQRGDRPFSFSAADYRIIDAESEADLLMSHISTNFDRSGFLQDVNVVFPLERLRELAVDGEIGSVARYHYSFMGATDPERMQASARDLANVLGGDGVDLALLVPV
jgi:D-proline reductase (dithiol) PrdB